MKAKCVCLLLALVLSVFGAAAMPEPSMAAESSPVPAASIPQERGVSHAIIESLTGDVYAEPSKWRELCLTLIHLISIPVTNTSVNPARSTGPALIVGGWALAQLWLFWVAPMIGASLGGIIYRWLGKDD